MNATRRTLLLACAAGLALAASLATWAEATPPTGSASPRGDLRVVVFGDFNGPYGSLHYPPAVARTVAAIADLWQPDLVLLPGDLIAGQSRSLPDERFAEMWAAFDAAVAAPLRRAGIPYAATMGNHDASKLRDAGGAYAFARERDAAAAYWSADDHLAGLDVVDAEGFPFAWSFRLGPLLIAVIDASGPVLDAAEQAWLRSTLRSPPSRTATLRWVVGHLPLVGIAEGRAREGEVLWRSEGLRDLLVEEDVDTYVSGHQAAFYAGHWGGLELLFAGGVGARRLLGASGPPRSAVAVVDITLDPLDVRVTAFDPADPTQRADAAVPATLEGFGGVVTRSSRWSE